MESIIEKEESRETDGSDAAVYLSSQWEDLLSLLPTDLDGSALETKALVRRRGVRSGADLLRICLAYAMCDWSLRVLAAWCSVVGICDISDVALLGRLRQSSQWLGRLIMQMMAVSGEWVEQQGVCLRLMDATVISRPGSQGTDWRVHLSLNLGQMCLDGIQVTDAQGGESLARFETRPGEIVVADRGLAFASSLGPVLASDAWLCVRTNWQNLPLFTPEGQRFDLPFWLHDVVTPAATEGEKALWLPTPQGYFPVRLLAGPLPPEAADRARQRVRKAARKKGRTPDERSLLAAGFLLVFTNLPPAPWPAPQVLRLYRVRWQVELVMKRLKSLLHLDHLRAQDPQLVQTYLLAKLLAALLVDRMIHGLAHQMPSWFVSFLRPVSTWRLTVLLRDQLVSLIRGPIDFAMILQALPRLGRFLRNSPRQRPHQEARIRSFFASISPSHALS